MTEKLALKVNARVKRINQLGCEGVIKEVCEETIVKAGDASERALMIRVHWDNGTTSYFSPEALELVKN